MRTGVFTVVANVVREHEEAKLTHSVTVDGMSLAVRFANELDKYSAEFDRDRFLRECDPNHQPEVPR